MHLTHQCDGLCGGGQYESTCFSVWMPGVLRTKQWMHEAAYSHVFLFLPRLWALQRLPVGIPGGGACLWSLF